jgi:hypothetical protein
MGGRGSGQYPGNANQRGGKTKKSAIDVVGRGHPVMPADFPEEAKDFWYDIVDQTDGVAFSQDSAAIATLAGYYWRRTKFDEALRQDPLDHQLNVDANSLDRCILRMWEKFGLTPRDRQVLVVPTEEVEELDELEKLQQFGT